jgi:mycothiol synthase
MLRLRIERAMDPAAIAAVRTLVDTTHTADGDRPLSDHVWLDLLNGGRPGFVGVMAHARSGRDGDADELVGYGQASVAHDGWMVELVVAPDHRTDLHAISQRLLRAVVDVIAADGGGRVDWWVFDPRAEHDALAAEVGLRPDRELHQMRRPLPTGGAVTITTRPFVPGVDEQAWLKVNNRAFADHHEQGGWDLATLRQRELEPWFDPAGFLLHERDGRLAGFCWTKLHTERHPPLGEIYVIGVDPDFHGLGLGKQLTLAGLDSIVRRGVTTGMLYVDAGNTVGITMYKALGFRVHRTDRAYAGIVAASDPAASSGAVDAT